MPLPVLPPSLTFFLTASPLILPTSLARLEKRSPITKSSRDQSYHSGLRHPQTHWWLPGEEHTKKNRTPAQTPVLVPERGRKGNQATLGTYDGR